MRRLAWNRWLLNSIQLAAVSFAPGRCLRGEPALRGIDSHTSFAQPTPQKLAEAPVVLDQAVNQVVISSSGTS
jgi:hypothetical protein